MNEVNLQRLENKLKTVPQKDFDMGTYRAEVDGSHNGVIHAVEFISPTDCGTIGCALGHAPLTKGLEPIKSDFCKYQVGLNYGIYCERVFSLTDRECDWCFSGGWESVDNTPEGAAERIEYLIKNGKPPPKGEVI